MKKIRVVIVDEQPLARLGIRNLLDGERDIEVVGEGDSGPKAINLVRTLQPDILVLQLQMGDMVDIEVLQELNRLDLAVCVIILTADDRRAHIQAALQNDVAGFIHKTEALSVIVQAIRDVARGQTGWLSEHIRHQLRLGANEHPAPVRPLSDRELEVLRLLVQGSTSFAIGKDLGISVKTIEKHLDAIYRKLNVRSRTEAVVTAIQLGLIEP